jgi:hypothetical protein
VWGLGLTGCLTLPPMEPQLPLPNGTTDNQQQQSM